MNLPHGPAGSDRKEYGEFARAYGFSKFLTLCDPGPVTVPGFLSEYLEPGYFRPLSPLRSDACGFAFPEPGPPHSGM